MSTIRPISKPLIIIIFAALYIFNMSSQSARADGMVFPPPHIDSQQVFSVKYHHVDVAIDGQAAVTNVDQVFHNESHRVMEAIYMFPMVDGAVINRFSLFDGEREIEGRILDKNEARRIYESIVRQQKDPALLEYVGRNTFRASIYPIPANGDKRIKLQYSEVMPKEGGMIKYVYPLSTERFSVKPLEDVRILIKLRSKVPITNIYSPTHEVDIRQSNPTEATVEWKGSNIKPDRDLILYYSLSDDELPIQVLTHREPGESGYFMLLASPKPKVDAKPLPKNIVFVLDRTGSMAGKKIVQAKDALAYCLNSLQPHDKFNVITFNETTAWFKEGLVPASKANKSAALEMLDGIDARGGTNIDKALKVALLQYAGRGSRDYIVFLTDGQPTVGETDTNIILRNVREENNSRIRLFVFGVGYDVNAHFLDRLAQENKADADYVRPEENIEVKVSNFFDKVSEPVLTDLSLTTKGGRVGDIYPFDTLPDLYKGGQLIIIGRYADSGTTTFILSGNSQNGKETFEHTVTLPGTESDNDFIPRLWAARKIGYLLDEVRLHRSQELIEAIVKLSKEYGIPTEFTSFLADESADRLSETEVLGRVKSSMDSALKSDTGLYGVAQSQNARSLRNQAVMPGAAQREGYVGNSMSAPGGFGGYQSYAGGGFGTTNYYYDASGRVITETNIQNIGARTFYRRSDQWVDARYQKQRLYNIKQYSEAHFQLLEANSELKKYSTLGEVTVVINGNAVQIGQMGKEKLTDNELKEILGGV